MKSFTEYLWFHTKTRRDLINITDTVEQLVKTSGVQEGFCLVSAMHITAGIWVNDDEEGLWQDFWELLERLAPFREDYKHHATERQRGRPPETHPHPPPSDAPDHQGHARPGALGAGVLRGVRRQAQEAGRRQDPGGID